MTVKTNEVQKARWSLINQTFDRVRNIPSYSDLRRNTICVIAHLELQLIAKEEGLRSNPECRDELLKKIKEFLIRHIR